MITMMAVPFPVNRNTVPEPEENPPGVPDPEIIERRTGVIKKIRNSVKLFELVLTMITLLATIFSCVKTEPLLTISTINGLCLAYPIFYVTGAINCSLKRIFCYNIIAAALMATIVIMQAIFGTSTSYKTEDCQGVVLLSSIFAILTVILYLIEAVIYLIFKI